MDLPAFVLSTNDILEKLPHRYPFLLVDKVVGLDRGAEPEKRPGRRIHAIKNVTVNEHFFSGHFPNNPVMPGVLLIEAMAQAGALSCVADPGEKLDVRIAKVVSARFRQPVLPGDRLDLFATVTSEKSMILSLSCYAEVEGKRVAEADMLAKVVTF